MTTCYSCKKEIGFFKPRGSVDDVLKSGYRPPQDMTEPDKLCQTCLDEIKRTQIKGSIANQKKPMKLKPVIPLGLFAIYVWVKLTFESTGDVNIDAIIVSSLLWGWIITGGIVVWDYFQSWRRKPKV